jgi:hypothetical protein
MGSIGLSKVLAPLVELFRFGVLMHLGWDKQWEQECSHCLWMGKFDREYHTELLEVFGGAWQKGRSMGLLIHG